MRQIRATLWQISANARQMKSLSPLGGELANRSQLLFYMGIGRGDAGGWISALLRQMPARARQMKFLSPLRGEVANRRQLLFYMGIGRRGVGGWISALLRQMPAAEIGPRSRNVQLCGS